MRSNAEAAKPQEWECRQRMRLQTFRFTSDNGAIHLINLNRNEFDKVFLKLNIHSRSNNQLGQRYVFDLIQRDEHVTASWEERHLHTKEPATLIRPITINALTADNGNVELQALMPKTGCGRNGPTKLTGSLEPATESQSSLPGKTTRSRFLP